MNIRDLIEHVLVINLNRRDDRLLETNEEFAKLGLEFWRVEATDGEDLVEGIHTRFLDERRWKGRQERTLRNHVACVFSFHTAFKAVISKGWDLVMVCEDDVGFVDDFWSKFEDWYLEVPEDWQFLSLGMIHHRQPKVVAPHVRGVSRDSECLYAVVYRLPFVKEALFRFEKMGAEADIMMKDLYGSHPCYAFFPPLAIQRKSYSDLAMRTMEKFKSSRKLLG